MIDHPSLTIFYPENMVIRKWVQTLEHVNFRVVHINNLDHAPYSSFKSCIILIDEEWCESFYNQLVTDSYSSRRRGYDVVVIRTVDDTHKSVYWAMKFAGYTVSLACAPDELLILIERILEKQATQLKLNNYEDMGDVELFGAMVAKSPEMIDNLRLARILASRNDSILIAGGAGNGKKLLARTIHDHSDRRQYPFFSLSCRIMPSDGILETLFGVDDTGAKTKRNLESLLDLGSGGTIYLSHIEHLSHNGQMKLLRFLVERVYTPMNSSRKCTADVRIFVGSNISLKEMVATGQFSEDLFFQLCRFTISIPALYRRPEDISALTKIFVSQISESDGKEPPQITSSAWHSLLTYHWPGNVRELEHVFFCSSLVATKGIIDTRHLLHRNTDPINFGEDDNLPPFAEIERRYILRVMESLHGNKVKAAALLDINRLTLHRKLISYSQMTYNKSA